MSYSKMLRLTNSGLYYGSGGTGGLRTTKNKNRNFFPVNMSAGVLSSFNSNS